MIHTLVYEQLSDDTVVLTDTPSLELCPNTACIMTFY